LSANYAFQDSEDKLTGADTPNAPGRQFFVRLDQAFSYSWKFQIQANHIADRKRAMGDLRPAIDDYNRVDAALRYSPGTDDGVEIALIARNLFDEDIREPSLAPGFIPNDLPQAGRQALAEFRYKW
jgi:outer membrane receptor for ferrienterochelin and colicins